LRRVCAQIVVKTSHNFFETGIDGINAQTARALREPALRPLCVHLKHSMKTIFTPRKHVPAAEPGTAADK
jgi:hypothetical protein